MKMKLFGAVMLCMLLVIMVGCAAEKPDGTDAESTPADGILQEESYVAKDAVRQLIQEELESDVTAGVLRNFHIVSTKSESAEEGGYFVDVEYEAQFGDTHRVVYSPQMVCRLHVILDESGNLQELSSRTYTPVGDGMDDTSLSVLFRNPYVAYVEKDAVKGLSRDEITELLFVQWMESLTVWKGDRTFKISEFENCEIVSYLEMDTDDWGNTEGRTGMRPIPRGSEQSWIVGLRCDFKYLGFLSTVSLGDVRGGGRAFGNDGNWIDGSEAYDVFRGFVLAEWDGFYTLETQLHCLEELGA